jgi:hypothetical protein
MQRCVKNTINYYYYYYGLHQNNDCPSNEFPSLAALPCVATTNYNHRRRNAPKT